MNNIQTKLIGAYLLAGGALGTYRALGALSQELDIFRLIGLLIMGGMMVFSCYSGYQILKEDIKGIENGRAIMAIQFIQFAVAGFGISFYTGGYFGIEYFNSNLGFSFALDSVFIINLLDDSNLFFIRINLLAIFIFIYLTKLLSSFDLKTENE